MELLLLLPILTSFLIALLGIPLWIKKAKQINLIWEDMHKPGFPKNVAGSGGIMVILSFIIGILLYIAIITFYFKTTVNLIEIFVLLSSILIISFIAFIDDLLGWKKGGLSAKSRIILVLISSIPLIVINAGESQMMGIEFGLFYPLFFIPLGIVGASTTFNILAGYNGLEASQGILILSAMTVVTYLTGNSWLSIITLCMVTSLIAFYLFNKVPAKIFPGDIMNYSVGALIAIIAILGNIEKIAVIFFIPYMIEAILKIRGKLKKQSFARLNEQGTLEIPYKKIYGLEHLAILILKKTKKQVHEKDVVYLINFFQIIVILIGFLTL